MKKNFFIAVGICLIIVSIMFTFGCKKKKKTIATSLLLPGTWYMAKGRAYILIIIRSDGKWSSDVRLEGFGSKVVEKKGNASGIWHVKDKNLIIKVLDSKIKNVWEKGKEIFYEIVKLNHEVMVLRASSGRVFTWKRAGKKKGAQAIDLSPVIKVAPIIVNLNKISSNDRDRYFCLDFELHMNVLMPGEKPVKFRPEAREAAIIFLSSLIYKNVNTFDAVNIVKKKLEHILDPYLDGSLKSIKINNVMITSSVDRATAFYIEHKPQPPAEVEGKKGKENTKKG